MGNNSNNMNLPTMGEDTVGTVFESTTKQTESYSEESGEYNSLEDRIEADAELIDKVYDMKNNTSGIFPDFTEEAYQLAIDYLEENMDLYEDYEVHDLLENEQELRNEVSSIIDEIMFERG